MATLTVGPGKQHPTIAAAVKAAAAGDTIVIDAGTYQNDWTYIGKSLMLRAASGVVKMTATVACPNGKGIIWGGVAGSVISLTGFDISGAKVTDKNGAAFRYEGGKLSLTNCHIHHCENGILANNDANGTITLTNCEFDHCGFGDGYSHNIYVNKIASLTIDSCYFHEASVGHEIKSRALSTTIRKTRIHDLAGTASYSVDLPNGGNALIEDCNIQQGANSQNPFLLTFGVEGSLNPATSVEFRRNTFINDRAGTTIIINRTTTAIRFTDNAVFGSNASQLQNGGPALVESGTRYLTNRPPVDSTPIDIGGGVSQPPTEPPVDPPTEPPATGAQQASVPTWDAFAALEKRVAALEGKAAA